MHDNLSSVILFIIYMPWLILTFYFFYGKDKIKIFFGKRFYNNFKKNEKFDLLLKQGYNEYSFKNCLGTKSPLRQIFFDTMFPEQKIGFKQKFILDSTVFYYFNVIKKAEFEKKELDKFNIEYNKIKEKLK